MDDETLLLLGIAAVAIFALQKPISDVVGVVTRPIEKVEDAIFSSTPTTTKPNWLGFLVLGPAGWLL